jgi:hypothetical protein
MPLPAPRAKLAHASTFFRIFVSAVVAMSTLLLLWWNETDAVATNRSLGDAPSQVVSLKAPTLSLEGTTATLLSSPCQSVHPSKRLSQWDG